MTEPKQITINEYNQLKRHGYVSRGKDGKLYALTLDKETGATVAEPVEVVKGK